MIIIEIWKPHYNHQMLEVSIQENNKSLLNREKFYFWDMSAECQSELQRFIRELRNYFGFKLTGDAIEEIQLWKPYTPPSKIMP